MTQPRIPELLCGIAALGLGTYGVIANQMLVFGGTPTQGGWAKFGEHPFIFLIYLSVYVFFGIHFVREAFEEEDDKNT